MTDGSRHDSGDCDGHGGRTGRTSGGPRDHGGSLAGALRRHGGAPGDWLDLSTGINPPARPIPPLPERVRQHLPDADALERLLADARRAYAVPRAAWVVAAPGASALIGLVPGPFRTFETGTAATARDSLAATRAWSCIFPCSPGWLRLGLPGEEAGWARLDAALA